MYTHVLNIDLSDELSRLDSVEMYNITGGKLQTVSDYLLLGGSIAACLVSPYVGIPLCVVSAIWG